MSEEWHELETNELPQLQIRKLADFGFRRDNSDFIYETNLNNGAFRLSVKVTDEGKISTRLIDTETNEPYILHLVENAQGSFVGEIRLAYREVLNYIGEACGEHGAFHGAYVEEILNYVRDTYGDDIEYPWKDMNYAVIRSHLTKKWYAVFMKVHPSKIGLGGNQPIRIMGLHGTAEQVTALVDGKKYFPGYHMNRKYWYTICLDGSVPIEDLRKRIDESFILSQPKAKQNKV